MTLAPSNPLIATYKRFPPASLPHNHPSLSPSLSFFFFFPYIPAHSIKEKERKKERKHPPLQSSILSYNHGSPFHIDAQLRLQQSPFRFVDALRRLQRKKRRKKHKLIFKVATACIGISSSAFPSRIPVHSRRAAPATAPSCPTRTTPARRRICFL